MGDGVSGCGRWGGGRFGARGWCLRIISAIFGGGGGVSVSCICSYEGGC